MFFKKNVVIPTHEVLFIPIVNMSRSSLQLQLQNTEDSTL